MLTQETNVLLNLIKHQRTGLDKICLNVKDPFKSKYKLLINEREKIGIKELKNPKEFIDYSQTIDSVYENIGDYNLTKKRTVLIVLDEMKADLKSNEKIKFCSHRIVHKRENAIFFLFFTTILFQSA